MIHRPFSEIQEETLKSFPSLKSDKDGFVVYEVPFAGKKIQLTPEHLIGSYIYDRIEDIKAERHVDDLRLVLSVPSYFTEEQISRFQLGLSIVQQCSPEGVLFSSHRSLRGHGLPSCRSLRDSLQQRILRHSFLRIFFERWHATNQLSNFPRGRKGL